MRIYPGMAFVAALLILAIAPWVINSCVQEPLLPNELHQRPTQYQMTVDTSQNATREAERAATSAPPKVVPLGTIPVTQESHTPAPTTKAPTASIMVTANTPTPTSAVSHPAPSNTVVIPPTASPADVVEIESPPELFVDQSDTIRITLRRTDLLTYLPKPSVTDSVILTDVVKAVATPDALLEKAFGEGYRLMATTRIEAPDLEIRAVSPLLQPYDTETVTWLFSVSGKKPGRQRLTASMTIRWLPADSPITEMKADDVSNSIERQVWQSTFEVVVREPIVRLGSYTLGEIWGFVGGGGLLGAMLGWLANDVKDRVVATRSGRKRPQRSRN